MTSEQEKAIKRLEKRIKDNEDIKTFEDLNGWYKLNIKLLGNIYDNSELLEEGE